ncbi:MAG: hypothetical protein WA876_09705 [Candidatus Acidiferrales bacterium]
MHGGQAPKRADGRSEPTSEQLEHFLKRHLTVLFSKDKNLIEIGWVGDCGDKTCNLAKAAVAFYNCPKKPCPPISV